MNQDSFVRTLEAISEQILLLDPGDLPAVAAVHTALQQIAAQVAEAPGAAELVSASLALLDRIVLREDTGVADPVNTLGTALAALLEAARAGNLDALEMPAEFGPTEMSRARFSGLDSILEEFLRNQITVLEDLEALVLGVERGDVDGAGPALLRAFHTLKGESALLGLDSERLCHRIEDMLETTPALSATDTLLQAIDWLGQYFRHLREGGVPPPPPDALYARIEAQVSGEGDLDPEEAPGASPNAAPTATGARKAALPIASASADPSRSTPTAQAAVAKSAAPAPAVPIIASVSLADIEPQLLADFVQEATDHLEDAEQELLRLESDPDDSGPIHALFRAVHTIKGVAGMLRLDHIQRLAHSGETLMDRARHGEIALVGRRIELVFSTLDLLKRLIAELADARGDVRPPAELGLLLERLDRAVSEPDAVDSPEPMDAAGTRSSTPAGARETAPQGLHLAESGTGAIPPIEAVTVPTSANLGDDAPAPSGSATGGSVAAATGHPHTGGSGAGPTDATRTTGVAAAIKDFIKVDAARLDKMVDMIGELVIAESMVSGASEMQSISSPELSRDLGLLNKIIRELQEIGTSLRMIPVRGTFQKMARIVRDIAKKTGKQIEFVTVGEETELDKSVVDKIGDPLVHMVRNAVDHGIESDPARRRALGKPETGHITLRAYHREGNICIEVADDGGGIDPERIRAKAVSKGLIAADAVLSEQEVFALLFEPGFSTAEKVTDVSGRGVGMDVVRRNIESLRGKVEIQSNLGRGTTFVIQLPLTLAIIDGMIVRVGEDRFIVPTANVVNSFQPTAEQRASVFGRGEIVVFHDQSLPLFHLGRLFGTAAGTEDGLVLVLEADGRRLGMTVSELLGHQQIVIKSLGSLLGKVPGITGGAVLPDGKIGLILDITGLYKLAEAQSPHEEPKPLALAA